MFSVILIIIVIILIYKSVSKKEGLEVENKSYNYAPQISKANNEADNITHDQKEELEAENKQDNYVPQISKANNETDNITHGRLDSYDPYFGEAASLVVEKQKGSIGMLQREFKIGFNRAARIMDELEAEGVVGPEEETKPRKVLLTESDLPNLLETVSKCQIRDEEKLSIFESNETTEKEYVAPTWELLNDYNKKTISEQELLKQGEKIIRCFEFHDYDASVLDVDIGTRFISYKIRYIGIIPYKTIKDITEDIQRILSSEVLFEPVVNEPNTLVFRIKDNNPTTISFKELLMKGSHNDGLVIGSDGMNSTIVYDYKEDAHLLIGGTTGSGKSSFLDLIMMNLIYKFSPSEAKAILVDTSGIQLIAYNSVPHLLLPVVTDARKAVGALYWIDKEINNRLVTLSSQGVRSISQYEQLSRKNALIMPRIFVIIDDVADIMINNPEAEGILNDIIRIGRATGVHLVIATQKPTVRNVGTFVKSNISARVAFRTASIKDSQIIIDTPGAESIAEKEMFLYRKPGEKDIITGYAGHSDLSEIQRVVEYLRNN